ncbi:MAG TPA: ABC transporter permease [Gemmatimonadaceae bacterium]|nr:ABC transporter permease [Gemmatimonadaceae bacterium]
MDTLWQDLRYAVQQLRTNAGFTIVAVLTLALGIGANTAIFSVVNSVLLQPLSYRQPDRLVSLDLKGFGYWGTYVQFRERARTLDVAAYASREATLTGHWEPVQLQGAAVSANLFSLLGVDAYVGRTFLSTANQPGHRQVVVLSDGLWEAHFGADPQIIGRQIDLDGAPYTVVGVMPASMRIPNAATQFWVPRTIDPTNSTDLWGTGAALIARLRSGVTLAQARAETATLTPQMHQLFPWSMPAAYGHGATATPLRTDLVGGVRPLLLILLSATAFVLLIACVNVANLLLVRTAARSRELAIRTALGAGRGRLVRQLLTESVLLASLGGAVGLLLAVLGVHALTASLPADTPRLAEIGIDGRVLALTLLVALVTGLAFGLLPALRAGRSNAQAVLKEGGRGSSTGIERRRLSSVLVAVEVAVAVVLVTGASLLVHSFAQLLRVDPGFRTEHVVSATIAPPTFRYQHAASRLLFYEQLLDRLDALRGVRMAAITSRLPFGGKNYGSVFVIEGQPNPAQTGNWPWADIGATVSSEYLRTMGMRLLRGRGFTAADRQGAPRVVLINESLAKKYWPNEDPIGKRIVTKPAFEGPSGADWATIVGVVADVKHDQLNETPRSAFYRPLLQARPEDVMSVVVRTTADPTVFAASLRGVVASVDRDTPVSDIRTMDDLISTSLARPRFAMALLAGFGLLALVLGAIGIYGVIASTVNQRAHEIGVRMALGARPGDVLRMIVRQGLALVLAGIAIGVFVSAGVTRFLASLLYGVRPLDPLTFVLVPVVLVGVALLASYLPARRAARVDPVIALRIQ